MIYNIFLAILELLFSFNIQTTNTLIFNESEISYGYIETTNGTNGYINIKNKENVELLIDKFQYNYISYVGILDDEYFIAVCDSYVEGDYQVPKYIETSFILYNFKGEMLNKLIIHNKPLNYHNHNGYLIIDYPNTRKYIDANLLIKDELNIPKEYINSFISFAQGNIYINGKKEDKIDIKYPGYYKIDLDDNGYCFSYDILIEPSLEITGEAFNEGYIGEVRLTSPYEIFVNGEKADGILKYPGYYKIIIEGINGYIYEKNITIFPEISVYNGENTGDFINNANYSNPVIIYSNAISMLLDGKTYTSKEYINKVGSHTLTIYGENQMMIELKLTILPKAIIDQVSDYLVNISVYGDALLNEEYITGNHEITEPGNYTLKLLLNNEVYQTYNFKIRNKLENDNQNGIIIYLKYGLWGILGLGVFFIFSKK